LKGIICQPFCYELELLRSPNS